MHCDQLSQTTSGGDHITGHILIPVSTMGIVVLQNVIVYNRQYKSVFPSAPVFQRETLDL